MEVSGQRRSKGYDVKLCSFCEDYDITTCADGFCAECEVFTCHKCFVKHKDRKINRDHSLVKIGESQFAISTVDTTFEACQQHSGKPVEHYCPKHDQVCCGECIVLYHNGCKFELVRDKAVSFQNSKHLYDLSKEIKKCIKQAQDSASLVESNTRSLSDLHKQFVSDVDTFVDEIIKHINTMKMVIIDKGKDIMLKDTRRMDSMNKEIDELIADISQQNDQLEAKRNQPNKLFVASISIKMELKKSQQRLALLKKKNIVTHYTFQRDQALENILKEKKVIGVLLEQSEMDKQRHRDLRQTIIGKETYAPDIQVQHTTLDNRSAVLRDDNLVEYDNRSKQTRATIDQQKTETRQTDEKKMPVSQQMCLPLIQRQKFCENLNIDGQILSYAGSGVGLYISNEELSPGKYFEIKILGLGRNGSIAIGMVPSKHPKNLLPGSEYSWGYHSDGKVLYIGRNMGGTECLWNIGDLIRCQITKTDCYGFVGFSFTHNGRKVYSNYFRSTTHFAVGMKSEGDKVKVIV